MILNEKINKQEKEDIYNNLLKYCQLDTFAMVRILEEINKIKRIEGNKKMGEFHKKRWIEKTKDKKEEKDEKTKLNLVSLPNLLKGKDWKKMSKKEQLKVCGKIIAIMNKK
jgi:LPS O-antigen subunit length determinant protein (WzzB/FepE family)